MSDKTIYGILCAGGVLFFVYGLLQLPQQAAQTGGAGGMISLLIGSVVCIACIVFFIREYQEEAKSIDYWEKISQEKKQQENRSQSYSSSSQWEDEIADYVDGKVSYYVRRNDRSIIPGRYGGNNLEIDIYIPDLKLGFECNGCYYHDKDKYMRDKRNDTEYSEEMYKENYCAKHGIKLVHIWDDMSMSTIKSLISREIEAKRGW